MKIWLDTRDRKAISFTEATAILQDIARVSDVTIQPRLDGLAVSTRLYPAASKRWQRVSLSPFGENTDGSRRKVAAVCWHGHYRFMSEVFARFPRAKIATGHATYNGRAEFVARAEATGDVNRGAPIAPVAYRDACTCTDPGDADYLVYNALERPECSEDGDCDNFTLYGSCWHRDKLTCPECGSEVWDGPEGSKLAKCWNTDGHASGGTLAFDTMPGSDSFPEEG